MQKRLPAIVCTIMAATTALTLCFGVLRAAPVDLAADPIYPDQRVAAKQAAYWLVNAFQSDDGGYASFSAGANQAPSTIAGTLDAVLALAAAGYNPAALFPGQENTPIGYLSANAQALIDFAEADGGGAGKVVLALTASAIDPRNFVAHDFVVELNDHLEPSGAYGVADPFKQSIAMLGVSAVGEAVPTSAVNWLEDLQAASGSWDDGFGTSDSADPTAMAVMALLAAGRTAADPSVAGAIDFLAASQQPNGGWAYGPGLPVGANSTALVIQALAALGEDWYSTAGPWEKGGQTPLLALLGYQSASGAFQSDFGQGPFDDFYATVQALPAVVGEPFPLPARLESAAQALTCLATMQDEATGGWAQFAGSPPDAAGTSRAIQSIAALGGDPQSAEWTTAGERHAVEALEALTPDYLSGGRGGRAGVIMQGVVAAGTPYEVGNFAGEDLPLLVSGYLSPTGEYDSTAFGIFAHAEAMLGLLRANEPVDPSAVDFLLAADTSGDWGDADSNGIALQVLGGLSRGAPVGTLAALHATQVADGGWGFGGVASPSTSSEVAQGMAAVGLNPFGPEWSRVVDGRVTSAADVVMVQQGDNGCWPNPFGPGDDPYSTTDAILLLALQPGWGFSLSHLPFNAGG